MTTKRKRSAAEPVVNRRKLAEADVREAGELVLEAMAGIPDSALQRWIDRRFETVVPLARAELARRAIKR